MIPMRYKRKEQANLEQNGGYNLTYYILCHGWSYTSDERLTVGRRIWLLWCTSSPYLAVIIRKYLTGSLLSFKRASL